MEVIHIGAYSKIYKLQKKGCPGMHFALKVVAKKRFRSQYREYVDKLNKLKKMVKYSNLTEFRNY